MTRSLTIVSTGTFGADSIALFERVAPGIRFHQFPKAAPNEIPADILAEADVYYAYGEPPSREAAPKLRWVQTHWAGVDTMIRAPIFASGEVILSSGAGIHAVNIGEYTLMMMLALAHRLPLAFKMMQSGVWSDDRAAFMPMELRGATLGLIGYGQIGREIGRLAQAFGMRIIALRRRAPSEGEPGDVGITFVRREQLPALLAQSDFVVVATPLTSETRHMLDADALRHMKPSAYLINIGRGAVVDEAALAAAIAAGRIAGAALDVFEQEPLPADSPLWRLAADGRVILTPHIAGQTPHYEARAAALFAENLVRFTRGQPLINQVDFQRGY
ncbi:MAG: D-2-hydroxyacid dehydrogenase [Thermoflexales bacterium]|nr:D-2-hydroxyacid dehydrogenase [Thermoflexales bacterium]MDW8351042.1 D-2-hydroxyacid dehydrogenase [Anaerolineae bacterium]